MALAFPSTADTKEKKRQFVLRAWKWLHEHKEKRRAKLPEKLSPEQLTEWRAWDAKEWEPRMRRLAVENMKAEQEAGTRDVEIEKATAYAEKTWDVHLNIEDI